MESTRLGGLSLRRLARGRRLAASAITVTALAAGGGLAAFAFDAGSAGASSTANLAISQTISGSATSGSTVDTLKVSNAGPNTATNVIVQLYLKSATTGYTVFGNAGTCVVTPPPSGYTIGVMSCTLGSLASGASVSEVATLSGNVGVAFTTTATVGSSVADPSWTNNSSTVSSWFGPRADLAMTQTAATGASAGKATVVSTIVNHGPNTGNALQLVQEIHSSAGSVHATSNLAASCQFIPPAAGYTAAFACTTSSLNNAATWKVTLAYTGTPGSTLAVDSSVTANNPIDPVLTNNKASSSTKYHA